MCNRQPAYENNDLLNFNVEKKLIFFSRMRCEFINLPDMMDIDEGLMAQSPFYETQVPRAMKEIAIQHNANNDSVDAAFGYRPPFGDIRFVDCLIKEILEILSHDFTLLYCS